MYKKLWKPDAIGKSTHGNGMRTGATAVETRCSAIAETALQGVLQFLPKVEDWNWETILYGHYRSIFNYCDEIGLKICQIPRKKRKIRAITAFKVIRGHRGWYQSKACMRFPISD